MPKPSNPEKGKMVKKTTIILIAVLGVFCLIILFGIMVISVLLAGSSSDFTTGNGNVAIIPVDGVIQTGGSSSLFGEAVASSTQIVGWIENADRNPSVKAIIFEINSPGGSPVASEEIANAIKATNKTTVAWIREMGTSGAYWVASSCDMIVADRMSITGSIGVISSYLDFSGLMDDYNVTYQRLVSGKYKDIGSPYREMTAEEEALWQQEIDQMHEFFIQEVAQNRKMSIEKTRELATGLFYTGYSAKENGLIDELGGKKEAISYIEQNLGIKARIMEYKKKVSFLDVLSSAFYQGFFYMGRGFGYEISQPHASSISLLT